MDDFLDGHKSIGKDLDQNPASVKDADYLDHHKDLKNFLAENPGVSDQFQDNPGAFMDHAHGGHQGHAQRREYKELNQSAIHGQTRSPDSASLSSPNPPIRLLAVTRAAQAICAATTPVP
jgi:hypothetical protein